MNDELTKHLETIENEAEMIVKKLIKAMCIKENITEKLKENDQMEDECKILSEIIILYYNLQAFEEKEIYLKGGMDAYFYFKKLGILK